MTIERCPICGDLLLERHLHAEDSDTVYGTKVDPTQVVHDDGTVEVERQSIIAGTPETVAWEDKVRREPPPQGWSCVVPGCGVEPAWEILVSGPDDKHACEFHLNSALEYMGSRAGGAFVVQRISFRAHTQQAGG